MELGRAHHAERAVVQRDEGDVGAGHDRRGVVLGHVACGTRRWSSPRVRASASRAAHRSPPPTNRNRASSASSAAASSTVSNRWPDAGVAQVEHDRAVADARARRSRATRRGSRRRRGTGQRRSQLGITTKRRLVGPGGVLGREQVDHGAVEADDDLDVPERPAVDGAEHAAGRRRRAAARRSARRRPGSSPCSRARPACGGAGACGAGRPRPRTVAWSSRRSRPGGGAAASLPGAAEREGGVAEQPTGQRRLAEVGRPDAADAQRRGRAHAAPPARALRGTRPAR